MHYDTVAWTWAIPEEKLARTCGLIESAMEQGSLSAKDMRSLAGKLIHVKPLVPGGRFNVDKIMQAYKAAARTDQPVTLSAACIRQLRFWHIFLQVCSGRVDIPRPPGQRCAGALNAYTDAAAGTCEAVGRGTGGVAAGLVVLHPVGKADQRRWLEGRRQEGRPQTVGARGGGLCRYG